MYVVKLLFICQNYIIKLELSISDIGGKVLNGLVCDLALGQGDGVGFECSWARASIAQRCSILKASGSVVKAHVPVVVPYTHSPFGAPIVAPPAKGTAVGVNVSCVMDHTVDGTILVRFMFDENGTILVRFMFDEKLHPVNGCELF